jgi:hypothetical protein
MTDREEPEESEELKRNYRYCYEEFFSACERGAPYEELKRVTDAYKAASTAYHGAKCASLGILIRIPATMVVRKSDLLN